MVLRIISSYSIFLKYVWLRLSRMKVAVAIILTGALLLLHSSSHTLHFGRTRSSPLPSWLYQLSEESCHPRTNIALLKTHKCASSAIQNILFRYGLNHNLHFALPETGNYFGGGWLPFNRDMVRATPWYKLGHNILAIHMKWDQEQVSSVMPNDTVYMTIVREPSELFESLYSFTKMDKIYSETLDEFVINHEADTERYKRFLGYNQMTWDFGLPAHQINDLSAVQDMAEKAEREFDLVLVAERMEESLVLMSRLLCWELTDVLVLKINARMEKFKTGMSSMTQKTLKKRLASDYLLYDLFVRRFDQLVEAYGRERMERDVSRLRRATSRLMDVCGFKKKESVAMQGPNKPWSEMVEGYSAQTGNSKCEHFSRAEFSFINLLRGRQKMEFMRKFGIQGRPGLDVLPLGAEALAGPGDMAERVKKLQMMLVHKDPDVTIEGNITRNGDAGTR